MNIVTGTSGADFLAGLVNEINDIHGLENSDTIIGGAKADKLAGDAGDDLVYGAGSDDVIAGGEGNDVLFGSTGNDEITGGNGNDYISGGQGDDTIDAGNGDDVVNANSGNDAVSGGDGYDYLFGMEGSDILDGGRGEDYLDGGSDDDVLRASEGNDTYIGGSGFDTLDMSAMNGFSRIDLSNNTAELSNNNQSFYSYMDSIEMVMLGNGGGHVMGSSEDTVFVGGAGDDWFRGKGGEDVYAGGAGRDTYQFFKKDVTDGAAVDHITDFQVGDDVLALSDFAKSGQAWQNVVRMAQSDEGVVVQGKAAGVWVDIVVLDELNLATSGSNGGAMSLQDIGLF